MESINPCPNCGDNVDARRVALGYRLCLSCGEAKAKNVKHCIVPMPKSNYIVVTDPALLIGLNTSHKGGVR
jgi:ribosomal protein L37AE/L43A